MMGKKKINQEENVAVSFTFTLIGTFSIFDYIIKNIEEKNYKFNCNLIELTKEQGKFKELNLLDDSDGTFFCLCLNDTEREKELKFIVNFPKAQIPNPSQKEYAQLIFSKIREKVVYIDKENNQEWDDFLNSFLQISLENSCRLEGEFPKK